MIAECTNIAQSSSDVCTRSAEVFAPSGYTELLVQLLWGWSRCRIWKDESCPDCLFAS